MPLRQFQQVRHFIGPFRAKAQKNHGVRIQLQRLCSGQHRTALKHSLSGMGIAGEHTGDGDAILPAQSENFVGPVAHAVNQNRTGEASEFIP